MIKVLTDPGVIDHWGSTPEERAASYPCDDLIEFPEQALFRAVDVAAPAALVYRWLCQIRVAPYSYDLIDNLGRRSPQHLIEGLDELEVGQRFNIFRLASFEPGRQITLDSRSPWFGHVAMTYRADPVDEHRCRLVAKVAVNPPGGPLRLRGPPRACRSGDLVMMRKQLLTFRDLAERDALAACPRRRLRGPSRTRGSRGCGPRPGCRARRRRTARTP